MSSVNLGRVVGYSAYEIAVQNGFVGTEAEWLASLQGSNGADGKDGSSATIQVGTVSTGAAGSDAVVTNVGTSSAAVFNFTIPQGAAGPTYTAGAGIDITNNVISATGGSGGGMDEEEVKELIGNEYGMSKVAGAEPVRSISGTLGEELNISAFDLGVWTSS